ncbi:MAG: proton extrusion protein PcxA [Geitlerinemataceae cyanobacterium]
MNSDEMPNTPKFLISAYKWYLKTPERALDAAYRAAQKIRELEVKYFEGNSIELQANSYSSLERKEFRKLLKKYLGTLQERLTEYNVSRSTLEFFNQPTTTPIQIDSAEGEKYRYYPEANYQFSETLAKLKFIDDILKKYKNPVVLPRITARESPSLPSRNPPIKDDRQIAGSPADRKPMKPKIHTASDVESMLGQASVLPRSILRTIDRLKRELDPKAENEFVEEFRYQKNKTVVSLRFILILILIPLLTHQLSKNFVVIPLYDRFLGDRTSMFINADFEEEALTELDRFEEHLKFEMLLGKIPKLSEEEVEEELKEKVSEIAEEYQHRSDNAIENIFSDLCSLGAFCTVLLLSKRELAVLKSFMDDLIYGLSDSAKAFIIILFTDIFVGFHSPHGWEVILEGLSRHFGVPENRQFIFLFIATFPVILDTVMKYWIFRYLNRISPSAVATYRNMNE